MLALGVEPGEKASSLASQPLLRARQEDQSGLVVCSRLLLLKIMAQPVTIGNNKGVIHLWARAWLDSGCKELAALSDGVVREVTRGARL